MRAHTKLFRSVSLVVIITFLSLMMASCGGSGGASGGSGGASSGSGGSSNGNSSSAAIIPATTKVLGASSIQALTEVSSDQSTLTFSKATSQLQDLSRGDVIAIGVTSLTPYGLLRKVTNIVPSGDRMIVNTTQAALTDAIQKGSIHVEETLTPANIKASNIILAQGVTLNKRQAQPSLRNSKDASFGFDWTTDLKDVVLYDADGNEKTTYDQVVANGNVSFNLTFDLDMQIDNFQLKQLTFKNMSTETAKVSVETKAAYDLSKEVEVAHMSFPPIFVWVGALPVWITPVATINVGLDGSVSVGISADATQQATLTTGLSYDNGSWSPISNFTNNLSYDPPSLSAGASMKAYAGPQLNLIIDGVVGPYANIYGYLKLDADVNMNPWWTLYGGLESNVGVDVDILDHKIVDYEAPVIDDSVILDHADESGRDVTPPSVPAGLVVTPVSSTQLNLSWNASTDDVGVAGYKIFRDGTYLKSATSTSASDTGITPSTNYCYSVSAYDAAGNESTRSAEACAETLSTGYAVSGKVSDSGGGPIAGVTISLTGDQSATTTTNSDGDYSLSGIQNGKYTLTPSMANYTFSPSSISVTVDNSDVSGENFVGTATGGGGSSATVTVPNSWDTWWVDTGIAVGAGTSIHVTATGTWNAWVGNTPDFGPDGATNFNWGDQFLNDDIANNQSSSGSGTSHFGALIGYIGSNPPQPGSYSYLTKTEIDAFIANMVVLGSNVTVTAPTSGELWLGMNDDAYTGASGDNSGSISATVQVQ